MKKTRATLLAGMAFLAVTVGALNAQTIIFQHDFEGQPIGERPSTNVWSLSYTQGNYPADSVQVQSDPTGAVFGYDSNPNQYLMVRDAAAYGFGMQGLEQFNTNLMTLSFDIIPRTNTSATFRVLNVQFYGDEGLVNNAYRLHATSLNTVSRQIGSTGPTWGTHGEVTHFDIIMNNSLEEVSFFVGATEYFIPSGEASVWVDGSHFLTFNSARNTTDGAIGENIGAFAFLTDNDATRRASYDLDNITAYSGIALPAPPPATPIVLTASIAGSNIEIRWAGKAGKSYQVQYRLSLAMGGWTDLGASIVPGADGEQLATDTLSPDAARFYQVVESAVP
jgi:hypothetical protein